MSGHGGGMRRALGAIAAIGAMLAAGSCSSLSQPMRVTADFQDTVGVYEGNDVSVLGIKVGTITRIRPHGTRVSVDMALAPDTRIPAGVGAVTISPSVVTDRRVELTPVYRGGPLLRDGAVIPPERTRTPVEIDRVIKSVDELTSEVAKPDAGGQSILSQYLTLGVQTFDGRGEKFRDALRQMARLTQFAADSRDPLLGLAKDADRVLQQAADNDRTIRQALGATAQLVDLLAAESPGIENAMRELPALFDDLMGLVQRNRPALEQALRQLGPVVQMLSSHGRDIAEGLDQLPLQNLENAIDKPSGHFRFHALTDETIVDSQFWETFCQDTHVRLPFCEAEGANRGYALTRQADMGFTETLLAIVKTQKGPRR